MQSVRYRTAKLALTKNDEEPGRHDKVWAGGASTHGAQPPRATGVAVFVGWSVSVYDGGMIDVKP
jgi:hypothetical protein